MNQIPVPWSLTLFVVVVSPHSPCKRVGPAFHMLRSHVTVILYHAEEMP